MPINENPNITRTFENGKMVVTFKNGKSREITVETLETRKANVPTMIENRASNRQKMTERITERISNEQDAERKAKMEARLVKIKENQNNLPNEQELINNLQGWIDSAKASQSSI